MILLVLVPFSLAGQNPPLLMPVYPGSVEVRHPYRPMTSEFLTRESLEMVTEFYRRQPGMPEPDQSRFESSGALFTLVEGGDPKMGLPDEMAGVLILHRNRCRYTSEVLGELDILARNRDISSHDMQHLRDQYAERGGFSQTIDRKDRGEHLTETTLVYERYRREHDRLMEELEEAREAEKRETDAAREYREERAEGMDSMAERMTELMLQGKHEEAAALGQEMAKRAQQIGSGTSARREPPQQTEVKKKAAEILSLWEKGLEEIATHRYPVKIFIRHR